MPPGPSDLFEGLTFYIPPRQHLSRLIADIRNHGGALAPSPSSKDITHVVLQLDIGFRRNPNRPFVFGPSTLGDSEKEQEYWTSADVAYYFHTKYTRPPIFVQDRWIQKCVCERRFYGRAFDYGGWKINPQYSASWMNDRGWRQNSGRTSEDDDEPQLRRNSKDDRATGTWSRRTSDDQPCTSATGDSTSEADQKPEGTMRHEWTTPKGKRPQARRASTSAGEDVEMMQAEPNRRSNVSPVRDSVNLTVKKEPLSPPQVKNALPPSNTRDKATTIIKSREPAEHTKVGDASNTDHDVKDKIVFLPRAVKALPSSNTGNKPTATPKSRDLPNATKLTSDADAPFAGKELFPTEVKPSPLNALSTGSVLSRANKPQPLTPATPGRVQQADDPVSPTTQLPWRMAGLGVDQASSPQTPTPSGTGTQPTAPAQIGTKRSTPGSPPQPPITNTGTNGGTLVATPIPASVALEAVKAKRQRMAPPDGLTIRTPKQSPLSLYKVSPDGKVQRLRRECPAPTCGPGVFMAQHKDREVCGKCGLTCMLEANKPLSARISMAAEGPSNGHKDTQLQDDGSSQSLSVSKNATSSAGIQLPQAIETTASTAIQPPPRIDLTAMEIDEILDFAAHSPTTPRGQGGSSTTGMSMDEMGQSPSTTTAPSATHVPAGTPNTINGVGSAACAMSLTSPMSPAQAMPTMPPTQSSMISPTQVLPTSPTTTAMLPMPPTQAGILPMFPAQTTMLHMSPTMAAPSNGTNAASRPPRTDKATQTTPMPDSPKGYVPPPVFRKAKYPVTIHVYDNNPRLQDLIVRYGGEIAPLPDADFIILPHGRGKHVDPAVSKAVGTGKSNLARVVSQDWVMHSVTTGRMRGVEQYLLVKPT